MTTPPVEPRTLSSGPDGARRRIATFLVSTALAGADAVVTPLTGDASDRRYFRVLRPDSTSLVLAVHPGPIAHAQLPFVNVGRLLAAMPVPVPRVLAHDDDLGILALDDLGDTTLQSHLDRAPAAERAALYREAVRLIHVLQSRGSALASSEFLPYGLAFDVEKLTWELNFFTRHFLEGHLGATLSAGTREALAEEWRTIATDLAAEPRVLCHRDYHSRNLMSHGGRLHVIDFQDARLGPDTYDLVSLLRDSYVELPDEQLEALIAYFRSLGPATGSDAPGDPEAFRRRFDLMAVQRNLKALGTFGFQASARANPMYIQYVPRTLAYVRRNLYRHPRFARLRDVLAEWLPTP